MDMGFLLGIMKCSNIACGDGYTTLLLYCFFSSFIDIVGIQYSIYFI